MVLAIAHQLKALGHSISYGKPLGSCLDNPFGPACSATSGTQGMIDEDVRFLAQSLALPDDELHPTLLLLDQHTIQKRLLGEESMDYRDRLSTYQDSLGSDLVLIEGPGTLDEGYLFELSLGHIAEALDASVLLVSRFSEPWSVDSILGAQQQLGDRVLGDRKSVV